MIDRPMPQVPWTGMRPVLRDPIHVPFHHPDGPVPGARADRGVVAREYPMKIDTGSVVRLRKTVTYWRTGTPPIAAPAIPRNIAAVSNPIDQ